MSLVVVDPHSSVTKTKKTSKYYCIGSTETSVSDNNGSLIQSVEASMYSKGTDPFGASIH